MVMTSVEDFMESPLVRWANEIVVKSLKENEDYSKYANGEYICLLLKQSDPRVQVGHLPIEGDPQMDSRSRLILLDYIIRLIRSFYRDTLCLNLSTNLVDIYQIAKYPESEVTFKELEKVLFFILGICISGVNRDHFINQIQSFDTNLQLELVPYIECITDDFSFSIPKRIICNIESGLSSNEIIKHKLKNKSSNSKKNVRRSGIDEDDNSGDISSSLTSSSNNSSDSESAKISSPSSSSSCENLANEQEGVQFNFKTIDDLNSFLNVKLLPNVQRIIDERDSYLESIIELKQDKDFLQTKLNSDSSAKITANTNSFLLNLINSSINVNKNNSSKKLRKNSNINNDLNENEDNKTDNLVITSSNQENKSSSDLNIDLNSLIDLSDSQTIAKLIESIYKELSEPLNKQSSNESTSSNNQYKNEIFINCTSSDSTELLDDLKNKKMLTNNVNQKIALELVEYKIKLRQLVNEIEEKCEQIETLKDEIDDVKKQINKLRNENVDLQQKASLANIYSDELESLREKTVKIDKYESDNLKLKQRIEELEAIQQHFEEVKEENIILSETRTIMEKQINDYQIKLLALQRNDTDLNKYKQEVDDLLGQRELENKRLVEICEKNAKLELEIKNMQSQNISLDKQLRNLNEKCIDLSSELTKQQQIYSSLQQQCQSNQLQINESNRLRLIELENTNNEMIIQIKHRDQDISKLKEQLRMKEINLDECNVNIKVLTEQLNLEQDNKIKCERTLEQHKLEIKELQFKLDDCVNETRKLDMTIRHAAETNEQKENENKENFLKILDSHEKLNDSYKKLLSDHEQLQKIYVQLETDYDELYVELNKKHLLINGLNSDLDELKEKNLQFTEKYNETEQELTKFKSRLFSDACVITDENESSKKLELERIYELKFSQLNDEIKQLQMKRELVETRIGEMNRNLEVKTTENSQLRSENKAIEIELTKHQEKVKIQLLQLSQLNEKIHSLEIQNEKLEDEKSQLFEQLHLLLQQNQEILTQTLNSKDMYHEETKAYLLQLNNLKRQKEMLEQKIMEQYKNCPSLTQKQQKQKRSGSNCAGLSHSSSSSSGFGNSGSSSSSGGGGLIRQFVQKVRNKSSSSSSNMSTPTQSTTSSHSSNQNELLNLQPHNHNDLLNEEYCHKYSADDINYLNIDSKEFQNSASKIKLLGNQCLSSSSSSASTSSTSSSSCMIQQQNMNNNQLYKPEPNYHEIITTPSKQSLPATPQSTKLDPRSLKLGGRNQQQQQQSSCSTSSTCSSPITTLSNNSPLHLNNNQTTPNKNEFKRVLITSSPKPPLMNQQSPSTTSTLSNKFHQSQSNPMIKSPSSNLLINQPQQQKTMIQSPSLHAPINGNNLILTKKNGLNNSNSIQLIASPNSRLINQTPPSNKSKKIAARLADQLSKLRDVNNLDINENANTNNQNDDDDDDDDDEDDNVYQSSNLIKKSSSNSKNSSSNEKNNEIWLEYGCI